MDVQLPANPFPEPHTVPGCVDHHGYDEKVRFVKAALVGHLATVLAVAFCAAQVSLAVPDTALAAWLVAVFAALTILRHYSKSVAFEGWGSLILLTLAVPALGQLFREVHNAGYPVVALLAAAAFSGLYTLFAGRDFSFPGMVVVGSVALAGALAVLVRNSVLDPGSAPLGWIAGTVYLAYVAYDLAMILKRRRPGEIPSAVADFYRDAFNFLTYPFRVARHWQNYEFH